MCLIDCEAKPFLGENFILDTRSASKDAAENFSHQREDLPWQHYSRTLVVYLNEALGSIGELKGVIADALRGKGFTDVVDTQLEVAGNRSGVRVSVLYLFIGGRSFWQVVMAGGDAADVTQGTVNEVVDAINHLKFL